MICYSNPRTVTHQVKADWTLTEEKVTQEKGKVRFFSWLHRFWFLNDRGNMGNYFSMPQGFWQVEKSGRLRFGGSVFTSDFMATGKCVWAPSLVFWFYIHLLLKLIFLPVSIHILWSCYHLSHSEPEETYIIHSGIFFSFSYQNPYKLHIPFPTKSWIAV